MPARTRLIALRYAVCSVLMACVAASARADATLATGGLGGEAPAAETAAPAPPQVAEAFRSPRAVLSTFVERVRADEKKAAAELLDLSGLTAATAESRGPRIAYKLYAVLQRFARLPGEPDDVSDLLAAAARPAEEGDEAEPNDPYAGVPADPEAASPWALSDWDRALHPKSDQVVLVRGEDSAWRFSTETVGRIDALYEEFEDTQAISTPVAVDESTEDWEFVIRRWFPPSLRKTLFLLPNYQWLLLLAFWPIGRFVEKLTRRTLTWVADRVLKHQDPDFDKEDTTKRVWRPVGQLAHAAFWVVGAGVIGLPLDVTNVLFTVLVLVTILASVASAFAVTDLVGGFFQRRAKRRNRKFDDLVVPLASSTAKVLIVVAGTLATISAFDVKLPALLLGGLGIGGIAIALASQETLANFVGSIALLFDRPFEVGDWVRIDAIEGEIESLGFRSTRIRTGLNSQVTLPNSKLAAASVDNWGRRRYRRYLNRLGLEYGTPVERIEAFCEGIRELIRRHSHTRKDFYAAYFNDFGAASLDVIVVAYFEVPDWPTELRERHRLLLDIIRLADDVGVAFAFPTQTLHLHRGETPPPPADLPDNDPELAGARLAAEIAGELPNYQDRPGKVKFAGPTKLD